MAFEGNMASLDFKVSIIIPVYNSEKTIYRCLSSVLQQTMREIQVIVIDDGSTDDSLHICKGIAQRDCRVEVHTQDNKGVSAARNCGLKYACGKYIGFVDSDDWIDAGMFSEMFICAENENADIVIEPFIFHISKDKILFPKNTLEVKIFNSDTARTEMLKGELFSGHFCNKLFRNEILKPNTFNEHIYIYEDMLALWDVMENCKKIVWINRPRYHYFMNEGSIMNGVFNSKYYSGKQVADYILKESTIMNSETFLYAIFFKIRVQLDIIDRAYYGKMTKELIKTEYLELKEIIRRISFRQIAKFGTAYDTIILTFARYSFPLFRFLIYFRRLIRNKRYKKGISNLS